jgi:hypothetical protein
MVFSDTSNKNGVIQTCEQWTGLGDGIISGDATLLKIFTSYVNNGFDMLAPRLYSWSDHLRWDDPAHGGNPLEYLNIVSGSGAYINPVDGNSLDILNVTNVRILDSASGTEYQDLERMYMDDDRVPDAIAPNPSTSGVPTHWLESGNTIYLYPEPNYSATNGIEVLFEREPSYFADTDTTKEPGIPKPFHELLPLYASLTWLVINKPANQLVIQELRARIAQKEAFLDDMIAKRNPTKNGMAANVENTK